VRKIICISRRAVKTSKVGKLPSALFFSALDEAELSPPSFGCFLYTAIAFSVYNLAKLVGPKSLPEYNSESKI